MYEAYYGLAEKPFSLTPDPKYLYRSESHGNAFDLLQYAIRRREGFVVVTGDIGTGKTTICRALLEQIDRNTFTALVLNPFLTEEDLLKRILQDFGVVSRDEARCGRLSTASKQELIETLYDFLLGLIAIKARAVLIIDEAQNLPLPVLEQIRILSNLETDKEKLLQIILVGQLNLQPLLRSPEMRQLDQRVSIRYELKPLDAETVGAYVQHRLTVAGGSAGVTFAPPAIREIHLLSGGIPRLINLICDRALLAGYSLRANRITVEMVAHAAESLELPVTRRSRFGWLARRASLTAAAAVVLLAATLAVGATAFVYERVASRTVEAAGVPQVYPRLPSEASATILVGTYPPGTADGQRLAVTNWLEASGFRVYVADLDLGQRGRWQRVLAGAYTDPEMARSDADRLKAAAPGLDVRVVSAAAVSTP